MAGDSGQDSIEDLRGCMASGYDPGLVNKVLARLSAAAGVHLGCVWDYCGSLGPGGGADFYLFLPDGNVRATGESLSRWLSARPGDPDAPSSPGAPASWDSGPAGFTAADLPYDDGLHNYARRDDGDQGADEPVAASEVRLVTLRVTVPAGTSDADIICMVGEAMPASTDAWVLEVA